MEHLDLDCPIQTSWDQAISIPTNYRQNMGRCHPQILSFPQKESHEDKNPLI